ncbi:Piso0_004861 [Millerozyma farinosa CBS 7064]|uniref:Piso0_004861 protein n=1 Tax=Pichia sorbitophila (strain ATCC MYA-4447 / BCRC 22081 / CBS 7064 / NBRC 10061 / NRRL Y-12695) TaxID=559304 RepID=G8Y0M3_PICSO|nr:Piso0_004861 [Millerozyma farinosa CBS 7064]
MAAKCRAPPRDTPVSHMSHSPRRPPRAASAPCSLTRASPLPFFPFSSAIVTARQSACALCTSTAVECSGRYCSADSLAPAMAAEKILLVWVSGRSKHPTVNAPRIAPRRPSAARVRRRPSQPAWAHRCAFVELPDRLVWVFRAETVTMLVHVGLSVDTSPSPCPH